MCERELVPLKTNIDEKLFPANYSKLRWAIVDD